MATMQHYRTARTEKACDNYPRCSRGIHPGERYMRSVATPNGHWWTLNICCEHMRPESLAEEGQQQ